MLNDFERFKLYVKFKDIFTKTIVLGEEGVCDFKLFVVVEWFLIVQNYNEL